MLGLNIVEEAGYLDIVKVKEFSIKCDKAIGYLLFLLHYLIKFSEVAITVQLT